VVYGLLERPKLIVFLLTLNFEGRIQRTTRFLQFISNPELFNIELYKGNIPNGKNESVVLSRKNDLPPGIEAINIGLLGQAINVFFLQKII